MFAVSYLTSIVCLFLVFHFALDDPLLSLQYYTSYLVPACVLALLVLCGRAERLGRPMFGAAALHVGTGLVLLAWLALPVLAYPKIALSPYTWLVVAAVSVAAAMALRRYAVVSVVFIASLVLLSLSEYWATSGFYQIRIGGEDNAFEWDVYRGAKSLQQFVNASVSPTESVGFWYRNDDNGDRRWHRLNSIQSTFLWAYTRVTPADDSPGMPVVDEKVRPGRFLVLLGLSDSETDAGLAALDAANLPFREIKRVHFQGDSWGYTAVLIQMKPPRLLVGPLLLNLPLTRLEIDPVNVNGSISRESDGLHVITSAARWSNSVRTWLQLRASELHGAVTVRVRLRVEEGRVGVGISTVGDPSNWIRQAPVYDGPEVQDVYLDLPDANDAGWLFIRNESGNGRSRFVVNSVEIFAAK